MRCPTSSTTPDPHDRYRRVRVMHPFHPLSGRDFEFVAYRQNWGEDRVHLHDENGQLFSLPAGWTDVVAADPFVVIAAGRARSPRRACWRSLIWPTGSACSPAPPGCKGDYAVNVRRIMPLRFASWAIKAGVYRLLLLVVPENAAARRLICNATAPVPGRVILTVTGM